MTAGAKVSFPSLVALLEHHAATTPDDRAFVFLSDKGIEEAGLTFAALEAAAHAAAARLSDVAEPGDRALIVCPPGLEFIVAFFACMIARVIAVPMMVPRRLMARDSSAAIMANCDPKVVLTSPALESREDLRARFGDLPCLAVDPASRAPVAIDLPAPEAHDIAFLQYTSGSTSDPKGVVVRHGNLIANLEMIRVSLGNTRKSTYVNWVPLYHDMGLVLNALEAFYVGALCVLMSPNGFMQRPLSWLRVIHHYRAEVACGPNFGYDLCVSRYRADQMEGVDLSSWKVALNGAEPVRAGTIARFHSVFARHGFAAGAAFPAYGMAEATLLISGGRRGAGPVMRTLSRAGLQQHEVRAPASEDDAQIMVGCGRALIGERIAIVDPQTCRRLGVDRIGEIWVDGPNVARTYWRNRQASEGGLNARMVGEDGVWLRTGDLGFIDRNGELFVTGRIKDLIIIRGNNHYPQDIERTAEAAHPSLRAAGAAAFSVPDEQGDETLVIVQEVERTERNRIDVGEISGLIREAVNDQHELYARHIVLIRPGTLPKTTSGKVRRAMTRALWYEGDLERID